MVSIRTTTDKERIKNFSKGEREIWNEWQSKKHNNIIKKKATYEDYVKAYGEAMKYL
jgi:hypothetical protein